MDFCGYFSLRETRALVLGLEYSACAGGSQRPAGNRIHELTLPNSGKASPASCWSKRERGDPATPP